ncbi:MAG: AAA family ATPase, partial [Anaerolineae bacterium]|nr:AAA family ATPase [Anaerolineae bacterium]NIN97706.1 AAA family ATPase [Anaerolineae bacterium]NIQ80693.1 AAA family ATPase [Anaerolineae bacterium]
GGKTYTAWLIARGLIEKLSGKGDKRPLLFLDTETGSDFLVTLAKEAKVPLYVAKTRAFSDLVQGVVDAEKEGAVLVIDSITHFWQELLTSYAKAKGRTGGKLYFQDWGPIKETWRGFTDLF